VGLIVTDDDAVGEVDPVWVRVRVVVEVDDEVDVDVSVRVPDDVRVSDEEDDR
jgi:hypothetical protein